MFHCSSSNIKKCLVIKITESNRIQELKAPFPSELPIKGYEKEN